MAKLPLGRILKTIGLGTSAAGLGGAVGYGLSSRHDFAVLEVKGPTGTVYLTGRKSDLQDLKEAAEKGDVEKYRRAWSRVLPAGVIPKAASAGVEKVAQAKSQQKSQPKSQPTKTPDPMQMIRDRLKATAPEKQAAALHSLAKMAGIKGGLIGALLGGAGTAAFLYPTLRGKQFAMMNIRTPYGSLPIAGQRKYLEEVAEGIEERDPNKIQEGIRHTVPLHPAMAPRLARPKKASFFRRRPW